MIAELVVVKGTHRGEFVQIHQSPVTIGRARGTQLCLEQDGKASSQHARITPMGGGRYMLEDLGSTNGTCVNDERVEQVPLRSGDLIKIGRSLLIFRTEGASVHLSDIRLEGGGSSANVRPDTGSRVNLTPAPSEQDSSSLTQPLQELILAAGEPDLSRGLQRVLDALLSGVQAGRAVVFFRHPITGGLGCAALKCRDDFSAEQAVAPNLLSSAAKGEFVAEEQGAAAPITLHGSPLGVIYLDGPLSETDQADALRLLTAAGIQLGMMLSADRSRRLAASATEIVGLAQAQTAKRPVDLKTLLEGTERLFSGAVARRKIEWTLRAEPGLMALADPLLLGRGVDTLVEHVLNLAKQQIQAKGQHVRAESASGEGLACLVIERDLVEPPETVQLLLDPEGVTADLRRCAKVLDPGTLAVARVALLRAGARFTVGVEGNRVIYRIEMEPASGATTL